MCSTEWRVKHKKSEHSFICSTKAFHGEVYLHMALRKTFQCKKKWTSGRIKKKASRQVVSHLGYWCSELPTMWRQGFTKSFYQQLSTSTRYDNNVDIVTRLHILIWAHMSLTDIKPLQIHVFIQKLQATFSLFDCLTNRWDICLMNTPRHCKWV